MGSGTLLHIAVVLDLGTGLWEQLCFKIAYNTCLPVGCSSKPSRASALNQLATLAPSTVTHHHRRRHRRRGRKIRLGNTARPQADSYHVLSVRLPSVKLLTDDKKLAGLISYQHTHTLEVGSVHCVCSKLADPPGLA